MPRLTASVLVLPAGAVQDPVAPVRGADARSRRAALYPGHRAFVLHLRVTGGRPSQPETLRKPHAHSESSGVLSQGPKRQERRTLPPSMLLRSRCVLATVNSKEAGLAVSSSRAPDASGRGRGLGLGQHPSPLCHTQVTSVLHPSRESAPPRADRKGRAAGHKVAQDSHAQHVVGDAATEIQGQVWLNPEARSLCSPVPGDA